VQILKIILGIILCLAFQGLIAKFFRPFDRVDLSLILTVYLALQRNPLQGTLVGASTGYGYDLLSGVRLLGASSFTKTVIGFVVATINVRFAIDHKLTRLFVLVVASIVNLLIFIGLHSIFRVELTSVFSSLPRWTPPELAKLAAWHVAGNLTVGFFLFPILDRIFSEKLYGKKRGKW
jgi:rod shape-determining protein MreD